MRGHHVGKRDSTIMKESPLSKQTGSREGTRISDFVFFLIHFAGRVKQASGTILVAITAVKPYKVKQKLVYPKEMSGFFNIILITIHTQHISGWSAPRYIHSWHRQSVSIGAATITEALAGVENSTIVSLGHWYSAAFLQYIRIPP